MASIFLRFLLVSLFYVLCFTNALKAQITDAHNVSITVMAYVSIPIETITIQSIDFRYEDMENNILSVDPVVNPSAGKMVVRGIPDEGMRLNFVQNRELVNNQTNHVLFFEYFVAGNDIDEQESSELLSPDNRDLSFNADGEFYIWVGGRVDLSTAQPGSYDGEFNIEIEYL